MKKYVTALAILTSVLVFTGMSWADNMGKDAEDDILHGHGAVPASKGATYVQDETRSNQAGTDLLSNPQDFSSSSASAPAVAGAANHDDHEDTLHAIVEH